jgi:hypothetical protein
MPVSKIRGATQILPAGATGQIQFNSANVLAGDAGLTYDPATGKLTVSGPLTSRSALLALFGDGADGEADVGVTLTKTITGTVFPTKVVWKNGLLKVVEKTITWTGANPTTIVWQLYDASEVLLLTITDTISYTGSFESGRTRVVS